MKDSILKRVSNLESQIGSKEKRVLGFIDLILQAGKVHQRQSDPNYDPNEEEEKEEEFEWEWSENMKLLIETMKKAKPTQDCEKEKQNDTK